MSDDQDWRLTVELEADDRHGTIERLRERVRPSRAVHEVESAASHDLVVTHDGERLFAYAADRASLDAARKVIEGVMRDDGLLGSVRVNHWDEQLDVWRQIEPPPTAEQAQAEQAAERDAQEIETRTLVVSSGRLIRAEFERTMSSHAERLGVECKLVEHPHLLSTQVAFTVTGPRRKLQEFEQGLKAEEWATIRTESAIIGSPL